jgi:uncharacterized protein YbaR (Trm112 family)
MTHSTTSMMTAEMFTKFLDHAHKTLQACDQDDPVYYSVAEWVLTVLDFNSPVPDVHIDAYCHDCGHPLTFDYDFPPRLVSEAHQSPHNQNEFYCRKCAPAYPIYRINYDDNDL